MKNIRNNKQLRTLSLGLMGVGLLTVSCIKDIDESNLYTSTDDTVETFLKKDSTLSAFNYILTRSGYSQKMETYGQYTCFAPTNQGMMKYIDSLYNDAEALIPHNGMTENSLEGLSDSLCTDISEYHLVSGLYDAITLGSSTTGLSVNTFLGRAFTTKTDVNTGNIVLNDVVSVTNAGNEVSNGYVHIIDGVIPRSSRLLGETLQRMEEYSIFSEALQRTGLADSLTKIDRGVTYYMEDGDRLNDDAKTPCWYPTSCQYGFTVFAEPDAVFKSKGINSFEDLVQYANNQYGGASAWYDYLNEKGIKVSTGDDYTNRNNALNMFVAYHILGVKMASDQLVFEDNGQKNNGNSWNYYNYCNEGEPFDYYETMLPHTMMKIWRPGKSSKTLYINRWVQNNTLTDEVGTRGSDAMHPVLSKGVVVERTDISALNGYIHPIKDILVYNQDVPNGVLHERMRVDVTTFIPEFINNGIRYKVMKEVEEANGGNSGSRIAFPLDYFENVKSYTGKNYFRYNVHGAFRLWQSDSFQGWGQYDLAVKLPHVPTSGVYELRFYYACASHMGFVQFFIGESSNIQDMRALDIPLDMRIDGEDPRIGWVPFYEEEDQGIASDKAMRTRGYMRGPASCYGHPENTTPDMEANNERGDAMGPQLRKILGRVEMKQGQDYWLRMKNATTSDALKWQFDFIEIVPVDIVDNDKYSEDWF